jgi:hypothetical protein
MIAKPITMVAAVVFVTAIAGCSQPAEGGPTATLLAPLATTPSPGPPTSSPSLEASPPPTPIAVPASDPARPEPPSATLSVEGGDPVVGQLGGYSWENTGSAAPWLPGSPIHVGLSEQLRLTLSLPVEIASWTASRTPFESFGQGEVGIARGDGLPIQFPAPPAGTWSVGVQVAFSGNKGSASYYWAVEVD